MKPASALFVGCVLLFGLGAEGAALAQTSASSPEASDEARALELFDAGAEAFADERYFDAINFFLEGDVLAPSPAFAFNTALAYQEVGDWARALRWSRAYLRRSGDDTDASGEMKILVAKAEKRLAAAGIQQMTILSNPSGATVSIDGAAVGVTPWTGEFKPGSHRIALRLPRHETQRRTVELSRDQAEELTFVLPKRTAPSLPKPSTQPAEEASHAMLVSSLVFMGLGLGGVGAGLGLELKRQRAAEDALDAPTQVQALDALEAHDDYQLGSRIAFGAGGALLAVGATILIVDLAGGDTAEAPRAGAICDGHGCRGSLKLSF